MSFGPARRARSARQVSLAGIRADAFIACVLALCVTAGTSTDARARCSPQEAAPSQRARASLPEPSALASQVRRPRPPIPLVLLRRSSKEPPRGGDDVLVRANLATDPIAREVARLVSDPEGYIQFVLRLNRRARTSLLAEPGLASASRTALNEPAYLFLSDRQGGFPVEGFWLEQEDGTLREKRGVQFVDMVVDEHDLEPGTIDGLEAIYAHELGHLVMTALAGPMPRRASNATHFVTVRTDGWTAFGEGWGEHFQPAAMDHRGTPPGAGRDTAGPMSADAWRARFEREQVDGCWICPANLRLLWWHGRGEQRLRDVGVRQNLFVHEVALPTALLGDSRPPFEVAMYRDIVPPAPGGPLKTGAAMMASEGVVATLFHRLVRDDRLQRAYREPGFYEPFLEPAEAGASRANGPASVIPPAENVYLKLFHVLRHGFSWGDWPAVELVKAYAAQFPDEAAAIYDVFLDVTRGITVEGAAAERQAEAGYLAALRDRLVAGAARIDGNLPRPLWIRVPGMSIGMGIYRYFPVPSSLSMDLNAADVADLRSVPGVSLALARAIVTTRERRGPFVAVDDLAAVPGMTGDLVGKIKAMHERMQARLTRSTASRGEAGWFKNVLVPALKGSYYAAAAWQFGRAIVLAAAAYLLAGFLGRRFRDPIETSLALGKPADGEPLPTSRRHRLVARAVPALAISGAFVVASACLYASGIEPTILNMAAIGLVPAAAVAVAALRNRAIDLAAVAGLAVPMVAAAVVVGAMY